MTMLFPVAERAVFSPCRKFRYALWREWDASLARCLFVMLNPSTADSEKDDPTIRRCIAFAKRWGFGALDVANLYAFRTPYPEELWKVEDPIGPENDIWIRRASQLAGRIIVAWGNNGSIERALPVLKLLRGPPVMCLQLTGEGAPAHPLYQPSNAEPFTYPWSG